ncbi:MAG: hypothetical protein LQ347_003867 [Umbilicaria vellea]|nr:MAG: hypothetical protein LQ347_003867 [Umbilicaria vellea]
MPPFKIAVLGGLVIDMVCLTDRIPDADDTITTDDYEELPSGKGGNSAVAAYRLSHSEPNGSETSAAPNCVPEDLSNRLLETPPDNLPEDDIQVHMVGAVGADGCGSILVSKLWENHVHTSGVRVIAGEKTGARLFVVETGSRNILKYFRPGANLCLLPTDFPTLENVAGGTKPDLVVSQLEIRQDTVRQILETANREGIETLLNPAPVQDLPTSIYKMITHLVVNKSEAAMLSGHKLDELTDEAGLASVTNKFLQMGVKNVVVTLGKEGAYYSNSPGNGGHVEAEKDVTVVDATGAGYDVSPNFLCQSHRC